MARVPSIKRRGLIALAAMSGLFLQMAWATAHYPMLLANLGTTQNGAAMRTMVLCVHRAKQQKIFSALQKKKQTSQSIIPARVPADSSSTGEQNTPSDELCTFSIALTGTFIGDTSNHTVITAPDRSVTKVMVPLKEHKTANSSYLASLSRAPPA